MVCADQPTNESLYCSHLLPNLLFWMLVAVLSMSILIVPDQRSRLSSFAKVVGRSERRSIGGMEVNCEPSEEGLGGLLEAVEIVPPAMTSELVLEVAPQALNHVELRRIGRQKEWLELVCMGAPPLAHSKTLVIARIVEHDHQRLIDLLWPIRWSARRKLEYLQEPCYGDHATEERAKREPPQQTQHCQRRPDERAPPTPDTRPPGKHCLLSGQEFGAPANIGQAQQEEREQEQGLAMPKSEQEHRQGNDAQPTQGAGPRDRFVTRRSPEEGAP
jgi:hypothetical protein